MKKILCLILLALSFTQYAHAQQIEQDLDMSNSGIEDFEEEVLYGDGSKGGFGSSAISLRKFCPIPGSQTGEPIGTKLGWAFGYGAMTILKAQQLKWSAAQIQKGAYSSHFLFEMMNKTQTPQNCQIYNFCTEIRTALVQKGNINASYDNNKTSCAATPSEALRNLALKNRVDAIYTIFNQAKKSVPSERVVLNTKLTLAKNKPVVAIIKTDAAYLNLKNNIWQINQQRLEEKWIFQPIVVVGYDDSRGMFEVMNSLGKSWGSNGFAYISYQDFGKWANCGFDISWKMDDVPITPPTPINPKPIPVAPVIVSGTARLNEVENLGNNSFSTVTVNIKRQGQYYETEKVFVANGEERIQFSTSPIKNFNFMYILSVDSNDKVDLHFPKQGETGYVGDEKQVTFPRPRLITNDRGELELTPFGFQKDAQGDDFLIILYAKKAISLDKIEELKKNIEESPNKISSAIVRTFSDVVSSNSIKYNTNSLNFSLQSEKGNIAPLIIKIKGN